MAFPGDQIDVVLPGDGISSNWRSDYGALAISTHPPTFRIFVPLNESNVMQLKFRDLLRQNLSIDLSIHSKENPKRAASGRLLVRSNGNPILNLHDGRILFLEGLSAKIVRRFLGKSVAVSGVVLPDGSLRVDHIGGKTFPFADPCSGPLVEKSN